MSRWTGIVALLLCCASLFLLFPVPPTPTSGQGVHVVPQRVEAPILTGEVPQRVVAVEEPEGQPAIEVVDLVAINDVLEGGGLPGIYPGARIRAEDVPLVARIVKELTAPVERAAQDWLSAAELAVEGEKRRVVAAVDAGQGAGWALRSPTNRLARRFPHEAISGFQYKGQTYILRAGPSEHPDLSLIGDQYDEAVRQRLMAFDTLVKPLFHNGG